MSLRYDFGSLIAFHSSYSCPRLLPSSVHTGDAAHGATGTRMAPILAPEFTFQRLISPASLALAKKTPRGSKTRALITPVEPARTLAGAPVATFHNLICVSSPA